MNKDYSELERLIGYTFSDKNKLITALTHKSYTNEMTINKKPSYERYEFLGDAVLEFLVSKHLFEKYPEKTEGELTKLRASLVCEYTLSKISRELKFGIYGFFSKGELQTGGCNRDSILCDMFEAVLGAIYLDGGIEPAKAYVDSFLLTDIENKSLFYDAKSRLQEYVQKKNVPYRYEIISEDGPEHNKTFKVCLIIDEEKISEGEGHSKKGAEQMAAYNALLILKKNNATG